MLNITKTRKPTPPRLVIYGAGGIGKSTIASKFPAPLFIQTENGLENIDATSAGLMGSYTEFVCALNELAVNCDHYADFKTIVIDSIDWLERLIWQEVCTQNKIKSIESLAYGRGYNMAADLWRGILSQLDAIRAAGKIIVLIAHGVQVNISDPETPELKKFDIKLHKSARALVVEWSDVVLFATRKRGTARGNASERVLRGDDCAQYFAKTRYKFPTDIPFDAGAVLKYITDDQTRKNEEVPF